ncbi:hypothetical protein J6590_007027 [Homalodisca vitripennis]|nr:hypothetical protein J6590_007027 [Homalodisca vitripennis]
MYTFRALAGAVQRSKLPNGHLTSSSHYGNAPFFGPQNENEERLGSLLRDQSVAITRQALVLPRRRFLDS